MKDLYLIRHGKSTFNSKNIITGQMDVHLDNCIIDTSAYNSSVSERAVVISSPASRCLTTSKNICKEIPIENGLLIDDRLIERGLGIFEGKLREEAIKENPHYFNNNKFIYSLTPPNGESFQSFSERIDSFYIYLNQVICKNAVIVCSHNQTLKYLYSKIMDVNLDKIWYSNNFKNGVLHKIGNNDIV
ncbi:alpha-ribazole phosphatase [Spirochaetia bacterium]|nr:alpha-ribazole phosphatase [Spirochaetia bacterium]